MSSRTQRRASEFSQRTAVLQVKHARPTAFESPTIDARSRNRYNREAALPARYTNPFSANKRKIYYRNALIRTYS